MKTYSVEEVAALCKVGLREVRDWFDSGRLGGHRQPGTGERRISRDRLKIFLKERGKHWHLIDSILIVSADLDLMKILQALLHEAGKDTQIAQSAWQAGIIFNQGGIDLIVLDVDLGEQAQVILSDLSGRASTLAPELILIGQERFEAPTPKLVIFSLTKPFEPEYLLQKLFPPDED